MNFLKKIYSSLFTKNRLKTYVNRGLQISSDCRLINIPNFGSEPYLISIGKRVTISGNVTFVTHDGGTWVFRNKPEYKSVIKYGRITIFDNVFIGSGVIIMPNVTIGPNSVVAAGSVVTKSVPENSIVGGNPAKVLMSLDAYAEKSLKLNPDYNFVDYTNNKEKELLRIYPRPW